MWHRYQPSRTNNLPQRRCARVVQSYIARVEPGVIVSSALRSSVEVALGHRLFSTETITLNAATNVPSIGTTLPPGSYKLRQWVTEPGPFSAQDERVSRICHA